MNPASSRNANGRSPQRALSVSVQMWPRMLMKPFSLPSLIGELANIAFSSGAMAMPTRSFRMASRSSE